MQEVPKWIIKVIEMENLECRACNRQFNADNLMSISIQESSNPPHKDYLCIGLYCSNCKELMIFELKEMSLLDFAFDVLNQETSNKIEKKSKDDVPAMMGMPEKIRKKRKKVGKKSQITRKEIDDVRNFLKDKNLFHEDFLIALGMLPDEIKKYNYKK